MENVFCAAANNEYKAGVMTVEVPLLPSAEKSAATFYNRHGDWFGWGCVGVTGLVLLRKIFRSRSGVA